MKDDLAIEARGLSKRYRLGSVFRRHDSLRELLSDGARAVARGRRAAPEAAGEFWALRDASFEIARGENVGIVGLNGAGKSTLLKLLSRITEPSAGTARIAGRVGALLEVGTGFHGELSGRENIYLYGAILGMSKAEISRKYDAIVEFSGIRKFIDAPVKRYSSGMYVRLAFAVAAHLEPEILLLDEVLSVGDLPFQRKCIEFAKSLQCRQATILFVSHNMFSIKTMCRRVIYLRQGRIAFDGPTEEAIKRYEEDCRLTTLTATGTSSDPRPIVLTGCELLDDDGNPRTVFNHGERMRLRLAYEARQPLDEPNFIVAFVRSDEVACCNFSNETDGVALHSVSGKGVLELRTPPLKLVAELYTVHVLVRRKGFQEVLCAQIGSTFHVRHPLFDTHFGVFREQAQWRWEADEAEAEAGWPHWNPATTV